MQYRLGDFLAGQTVAQCSLDVMAQFIGLVQSGEDTEIQQAALFAREAGTRPDDAPGRLGGDFFVTDGVLIGIADALIDIARTKDLLADLESLAE